MIEEVKSLALLRGYRGRVLVRYSGTQALCRVMVEGPDESLTRTLTETVAVAVRESLG